MNLEIETAQLRFRPLAPDDLIDIHRLWTAPGVRKYLWDDEIISRTRAASIIEASLALFDASGFGLWAATARRERAIIGCCGFWYFREPPEPELIYAVAPEQWGRGLATEAAKAMIRYGFEVLSLDKITASTDAANRASIRIMEKAGMRYEKRSSAAGLDTVYYRISREGYSPDETPYRFRLARQIKDEG